MDDFFSEDSTITISNGRIENIDRQRNNTLVTISYTDNKKRSRERQTVRLVVSNRTVILDENGNSVPVRELQTGMIVNAIISSAMTRSIPPQSSAFFIRIVRRLRADNITIGRILNIDNRNRNFTTIHDRDVSSMIRFNVPEDVLIFDRLGRRINFSKLVPGMRVRVRHATFMTASIPPQTTAFEKRVL